MRKYSVSDAVKIARTIRRNLLRSKRWKRTDLGGACGLASIILSIELKDVTIIEYGDSLSLSEHVWTRIDNTIIDITASQFDDIKGVLVTDTPREYHPSPIKIGMQAYLEVVNHGWYSEEDHSRWKYISEYFL
jgi:hypothetical protein